MHILVPQTLQPTQTPSQKRCVFLLGHLFRKSTPSIILIFYSSSSSLPQEIILARWDHLCFWIIETTASSWNLDFFLSHSSLIFFCPSLALGISNYPRDHRVLCSFFIFLMTVSTYHTCWSRTFLGLPMNGLLKWTINHEFIQSIVYLSFKLAPDLYIYCRCWLFVPLNTCSFRSTHEHRRSIR